jgi:hypothetical protein
MDQQHGAEQAEHEASYFEYRARAEMVIDACRNEYRKPHRDNEKRQQERSSMAAKFHDHFLVVSQLFFP